MISVPKITFHQLLVGSFCCATSLLIGVVSSGPSGLIRPALATYDCSGDADQDQCVEECTFSNSLVAWKKYPTSEFGRCGWFTPCPLRECHGKKYESDNLCINGGVDIVKKKPMCIIR